MRDSRAFLKNEVTWDLDLCRLDGCIAKRGKRLMWKVPEPARKGFFRSRFPGLFDRPKPNPILVPNEAGIITVKSPEHYIDVVTNEELLKANEWIQIPNIRESEHPKYECARFRTHSLLEHPHLYLGHNFHTGEPALLSEEILQGHGFVTGKTGSSKSSNALLSTIHYQLARGKTALVIIDMKGDSALRSRTQKLAQKYGYRFKWVSTNVGDSSYVFNPLAQSSLSFLTDAQVAAVVHESFNLNYGPGYGRDYYSFAQFEDLLEIFGRFRRTSHNPTSFTKLLKLLETRYLGKNSKQRQDSKLLHLLVQLLAQLDQLNATREGPHSEAAKNAIDLRQVIQNREVVYCNLPVANGEAISRIIANLVIFGHFIAAYSIYQENRSGLPSTLIIDEVQHCLGSGLESVLSKGRAFKVSALLTAQSHSQLERGDQDFRHLIGLTRFQRDFTIDPRSETFTSIRLSSGEKLCTLVSTTERPQIVCTDAAADGEARLVSLIETIPTFREQIVPRISASDLLEINSNPNLSFLKVEPGHGFSHWAGEGMALYSPHYFSSVKEYGLAQMTPWPEGNTSTITVSQGVGHEIENASDHTSVIDLNSAPSPKEKKRQGRVQRQKENRQKGKNVQADPSSLLPLKDDGNPAAMPQPKSISPSNKKPSVAQSKSSEASLIQEELRAILNSFEP